MKRGRKIKIQKLRMKKSGKTMFGRGFMRIYEMKELLENF